jgi:hypothetical protein
VKYLRLIYANPQAFSGLPEPGRSAALAEIADQLAGDAAESSNPGDARAGEPHHDGRDISLDTNARIL